MAKAKTITDKELEILFGDKASEVVIVDTTYPIYPFNMRQTALVVKKLGALIPIIATHVDADGGLDLSPTMLVGLLSESMDGVMEIVADVLKRDITYVESLDQDSFLQVVLEIIKVNRSFFEQRVKVTLEGAKSLMPVLTVNTQSENE